MSRRPSLVLSVLLLLAGCGGDSDKPTVTPPPVTPPDQPDTTPPRAVSDLAVVAATDSTAVLTWTAPGDDGDVGTAAQYDIRYSDRPITPDRWGGLQWALGQPQPLAAGTRTDFTVTGLYSGVTYYFALKAVDESDNWADLSNVVSAAVGPDLVPPEQIAISVATVTDTSATLTWTAPGDDYDSGTAARYDIRYSRTLDGMNGRWEQATQIENEPTPAPAGSSETVTIIGLEPRSLYFVGIKAADEADNWSIRSYTEVRTADSAEDEAANVHWLDLFGTAGPDNEVSAFCSYEGALVVGGLFGAAGGAPAGGAARWDGATWEALGEFSDRSTLYPTGPSAFAVFNGTLVAGGRFRSIVNPDHSYTGALHIAEWRNGRWSGLGSGWGTDDFRTTCSAIVPYNGLLAAGGTLYGVIGETFNYLQVWNGTQWLSGFGAGIGGVNGPANALAVYRGDLIVAGNFSRAGRVYEAWNIARYDGSDALHGWHQLGTGIGYAQRAVQALAVFNDELYAAGTFNYAGNHPVGGVAKWNGTEWSRPGTFDDEWEHEYPNVRALAVYNGRLIVGGDYSTRFDGCIATWDGTRWGQLGTGIGGPGEAVNALAVHDGKLFVGGRFARVGDKVSRNIACWAE